MNESLQQWINGLSGHSEFLDFVMRMAADSVYAAPGLLLALWFWPEQKRAMNQRAVVGVAFSVLIALVAAAGLGAVHFEPRPFVAVVGTRLLVHHAADNSFPSDHTTAAFALAAALICWKRVLGFVTLIGAVLTAFARVYVGVHWPTDVAAGAVLGSLIGCTIGGTVSWMEGPQGHLARLLPTWLVAAPTERPRP